MQKTCTANLYLCTRKLIVELKFGAYVKFRKMGVDDTSYCSLHGGLGICRYYLLRCAVCSSFYV